MRYLAALLLLSLVAACGKREAEAPEAAVQRGIDRSVADVRAAEAAAAAPVEIAPTVAELRGSATASKTAEAGTEKAAEKAGG